VRRGGEKETAAGPPRRQRRRDLFAEKRTPREGRGGPSETRRTIDRGASFRRGDAAASRLPLLRQCTARSARAGCKQRVLSLQRMLPEPDREAPALFPVPSDKRWSAIETLLGAVIRLSGCVFVYFYARSRLTTRCAKVLSKRRIFVGRILIDTARACGRTIRSDKLPPSALSRYVTKSTREIAEGTRIADVSPIFVERSRQSCTTRCKSREPHVNEHPDPYLI